ncbi:MAG: hypothetical protein GW947_00770 [Candidatus Pacebacteria bacterium]|nr:hypothetical protein [Candidatus Paceibacterota bacterium]
MNIHLMGSLFDNQAGYAEIAAILESEGHHFVTRYYLERTPKKLEAEKPEEMELFYKKVLSWIKKADFVIFEVSNPCVEVGYDLSIVLSMSKPVLVLYNAEKGAVPYGLRGLHLEKLQVSSYTDKNLKEVLLQALDWASELANIRFDFPLDAEAAEFLDAAATKKQVSRVAFLQQLLEKEKIRGRG